MQRFILGRKLGMTQTFNSEGKVLPVTVIGAWPCFVEKICTIKEHGYSAILVKFTKKLGADQEKKGQRKGDDFFYREFRLPTPEAEKYKAGEKIDVSGFAEGETVKIAGTSKGKGFQGVVKRWGFKGSASTHGHKHDERAPGSIGSSFPEKVFKGLRMAGKMGNKRITAKGLRIVKIDAKNNLLAVKGAVPGVKNGLLEVRSEN